MTVAQTSAFRALHQAATPLLLPQGWDYASIATLASEFPAVGTTSLGVAAAAGKPDAAAATAAETLALAAAASGLCLLSVDIEGGFSDEPAKVGALAAELYALGVVGINIEDGRGDDLVDAKSQARLIAAIKERAPGLFVNARSDGYWLQRPDPLAESLRRLVVYAAAGADGLFVPGVADGDEIRRLVEATNLPLNILYSPTGPDFNRLAALGVRRVSLGSLLFRATLATIRETTLAVRDGVALAADSWPSYAAVQAMLAPAVGTESAN